MAINSDVDIYLAVDKLGKSNNKFRLTQSCPPHSIIEWSGPDAQPTDAEINTAWTNWENQDEYKIKRGDEYPSITDQLDDLYHNGIDGWKTTIKATKDKYPKP